MTPFLYKFRVFHQKNIFLKKLQLEKFLKYIFKSLYQEEHGYSIDAWEPLHQEGHGYSIDTWECLHQEEHGYSIDAWECLYQEEHGYSIDAWVFLYQDEHGYSIGTWKFLYDGLKCPGTVNQSLGNGLPNLVNNCELYKILGFNLFNYYISI